MEKSKNYKSLKINADDCPKIDQPIIKDQCVDVCRFYEGFDPDYEDCIKCSNHSGEK